jgi:hypothetical protein
MNGSSLTSLQLYHLSQEIEKKIKVEIPKFQIKSKKDSWFMKLLSYVLFFNKKFMTGYVTTIYPIVYFPDSLPVVTEKSNKENLVRYIDVLLHETTHLLDRKKYWIFFNLFYLSPQIFTLLSLLAFFLSPWWLMSFLFLTPIPSVGRTWAEFRGFSTTFAIYYWLGYTWREDQEGNVKGSDEFLDAELENFTGINYYFMWPFRNQLKKKFMNLIGQLKKGQENQPDTLPKIHKILLDSYELVCHN